MDKGGSDSRRSSPPGSANGRSPSPLLSAADTIKSALLASSATGTVPHAFPPVRSKSGHIVDWAAAAQQQQQQLLHHEQHKKLLFQSAGGDGGGKLSEEYSYVKFPPRPPDHDYSYPKLSDALAAAAAAGSSSSSEADSKRREPVVRRDSISSIKRGLLASSPPTRKPPVGSEGGKSALYSPPPRLSGLHGGGGSGGNGGNGSGGGSRSGSSSPPSAGEKVKRLVSGSLGGQSPAAPGFSGGGGRSSGSTNGSGHGVNDAASCYSGSGGHNYNSDKRVCLHCRESFTAGANKRGACDDAPDCGRSCVEAVTCLQCAKCLLYHCMSDSEGDYAHPCDCSNSDGHRTRRWMGLTLLSILVPCLCCYVPMIGCYKLGKGCSVCGGAHQAS